MYWMLLEEENQSHKFQDHNGKEAMLHEMWKHVQVSAGTPRNVAPPKQVHEGNKVYIYIYIARE